jgi:hypothetical protein
LVALPVTTQMALVGLLEPLGRQAEKYFSIFDFRLGEALCNLA